MKFQTIWRNWNITHYLSIPNFLHLYLIHKIRSTLEVRSRRTSSQSTKRKSASQVLMSLSRLSWNSLGLASTKGSWGLRIAKWLEPGFISVSSARRPPVPAIRGRGHKSSLGLSRETKCGTRHLAKRAAPVRLQRRTAKSMRRADGRNGRGRDGCGETEGVTMRMSSGS